MSRPPLTSSSSSNVVETKEIKLSDITVPERLRQLQPGKAEAIADSIKDVGLLEPIVVRPTPEGPTPDELVIGNHRKQAHHILEIPSVRADIQDLNKDQALLAEI